MKQTDPVDHRLLIGCCTCVLTPLQDRMTRWYRRAAPVLRRLPYHGHKIDMKRCERTLELLVGINTGNAASFSLENWTRSHHLPECPCSNRKNPRGRVTVLPLTQCQQTGV